MRNKGITQIGILVKDIQESVEQYWDTLGIGPWSIYTFNQDTLSNFSVHGNQVKKPFKFVIAKCMCGNIDIELIQHVEGQTVYEDFIKEKGFGLHHIKEQMDDAELEKALEAYKEKGIDVIQSGMFGENVHNYLNTKPVLGIIYEIGNFGKIPEPERQYPSNVNGDRYIGYEKRISEYLVQAGLTLEKNIKKQLQCNITNEKKRKEELSVDQVLSKIQDGFYKQAGLDIVLLTKPDKFNGLLDLVREQLDNHFMLAADTIKENSILFIILVTLNLKSYLPYWNLMNEDVNPKKSVKMEQVNYQIEENLSLLTKWQTEKGSTENMVLDYLNRITQERFESEDLCKEDISEAAHDVVGGSITHYINRMSAFIEKSNLEKISKMRKSKATITEIGNDYAAHLLETMWLGASFVTTNPQLASVNLERKLDFDLSYIDDLVIQFLIGKKIKKATEVNSELIEELADVFTAEVVINNAELLRSIFLLTEGKTGYTCLQVSPVYYDDTERMVAQALRCYAYLLKRLDGIPNVVIKLPGTKAGLETQKVLTGAGIGTTLTVSFGLFQIISFAKEINLNNTIVSHLALMSGRLAYPVRDELLKLGVPHAVEAAQWAGVAVGKKAYRVLYDKSQLGMDPLKVKLLIASLRNYGNLFPDITGLLGTPIITVFPNIRNQFDSINCELDPRSIEKPLDESILKTLCYSEIFKQAYYLPGDSTEFRPKTVLSLDDSEAVRNWVPIKDTLDTFIQARLAMEAKLKKKTLAIIEKV